MYLLIACLIAKISIIEEQLITSWLDKGKYITFFKIQFLNIVYHKSWLS